MGLGNIGDSGIRPATGGRSTGSELETGRAQARSSLKDIHREEAAEGLWQRVASFAELVRAGLVSPPENRDRSFTFVAATGKGLSGAAVTGRMKASGCIEAKVFEFSLSP